MNKVPELVESYAGQNRTEEHRTILLTESAAEAALQRNQDTSSDGQQELLASRAIHKFVLVSDGKPEEQTESPVEKSEPAEPSEQDAASSVEEREEESEPMELAESSEGASSIEERSPVESQQTKKNRRMVLVGLVGLVALGMISVQYGGAIRRAAWKALELGPAS